MPSKSAKSRLLGEIDRYLVWLEERGCTPDSIRGYRWALRNIADGLCEAGFTLNPRKIGQHEVSWLYKYHFAGWLNDSKATELGKLHGFLKWAGNKQTIFFPKRTFERPNVRWLSKQQEQLLKASATGLTKVLVHFGLDLGMRRCEMLRLKESSFRTGRRNTVMIIGKGHGSGKPRELSWHKKTPEILEIVKGLRDNAIFRAKARNVAVTVPENLLVYECGGKIKPFHKSALDNRLRGLGRTIGMDQLGFHDLRRTFGRTCHDAGIRIERIAYLLGHTDTKTTIRYLGLNTDDTVADMETIAAYQESVEVRKVETSDLSQQNGGPCGI